MTLDNKPHLVFIMPMLLVKFVEHFFQPGSGGDNVYYVRRNIPASRLQPFDLVGKGLQYFLISSVRRHLADIFPPLVIDAYLSEAPGNSDRVSQPYILAWNINHCHKLPQPASQHLE